MSKDIIYREDAIKAINTRSDWYQVTCNGKQIAVMLMAKDVNETLKNVPSAYQPQGEWVEVDDYSIRCKCSICGWESHKYEDDVYGMPYCPNCGTQMKGIDDETAMF